MDRNEKDNYRKQMITIADCMMKIEVAHVVAILGTDYKF